MAAAVADKVVLELEARSNNYLSNINNSRMQFDKHMDAMTKSAERMEKRTTAASRYMSQNLARAISAIAIAAAIKDVAKFGDTWTQTGNKLAAAGVQTEKVAQTQAQLVRVARDTRSEYAETANTYSRILRSTQALNATDTQRLRITELINKATKAGGATTQEQISTITQLTQALASGNLQGDELRSIRENSPLLAKAIADELGTTIGGLKALGKEGKITSDVIVKAILNAGDAIDSQFAKTRATIGESFTAIQTEAIQFLGNFDKALGATEGISKFASKVADDFDLLAQAVIVASALVGGALIGNLTKGLQAAAVSNAQFVASMLNGTAAFQVQEQTIQKNARAILYKAQTDREAAREEFVNSQQRIAALKAEAVQIEANIAAEQQRLRMAASQANTGRSGTGQFASRGAGEAAVSTSQKALIASSMQLQRVTQQLNATQQQATFQHGALRDATDRAAQASTAYRASLQTMSAVGRASTIAMKGLGVAMSFFGGPIGLAIMAVAGSLAYFATQAAKAEAAGSNAKSMLDDIRQSAEETNPELAALAQKLRDGADASNKAAGEARGASGAYDQMGMAAKNAAEYVKYLTAAQRQQKLEEAQSALRDLRSAQRGGGPLDIVTTDNQERVNNARSNLIRKAGVGRGGMYDNVGNQEREAFRRSQLPGASQELKDAALEYRNRVAVYNSLIDSEKDLQATVDVIRQNIASPTLEAPKPSTANLTSPGATGGSGGGSGGGRGRSSREETREELEARREIFELQQRLNEQQAAGATTLAQFTQDELDRRRIIADLIDQQYSPEQAEAQAKIYIDQLRAARQVAEEAKRQEDATKAAEEAKKDADEKAKERKQQQLFLQEQDLLLQRELARLAGNEERVKALDLIIDRLQRINELQGQGGLSEADAIERATREGNTVATATASSEDRAVYEDYARTFLDSVRNGEDVFAALGSKFANAAVDDLTKLAGGILQSLFSGAGVGGASTGPSNFVSSIMGLFGKKIPGFASGTNNAPGGLSYVHAGELLVNLQKGTKVIPADTVKRLGNTGARANSPQPQSTRVDFKQTIDISGANGDATIRRLAYEAAAEGSAAALEQARKVIPAEESKRSQYRTRK